MKQHHTLQPKLRFPEFEEEWLEFKFKDLYEFKSTNSFSRDKLNYEIYNVKNIHYGDIHVKFKTLFDITKENVPYINEEIDISKISEDNYLKEGDVIIADASENYDDIGKAIEIINLNNEKVISGLHTFLARKISDINYNGFISYVFKTKIYRHQIYKIAQGTKVLSLSSNRVANLNLNIPSLPEQQKIADYLSTIDNKINLLEEKKAQLALYKKAMMQKLFSQEIRFKPSEAEALEAYPEWEEKRLGEVVSLKGGYAFKSDLFKENGVSIMRISNISNNNIYIDENNMVYYDDFKISNSYKVFTGELLIALSGATTGKASIYNLENFSYVNQRVGVFKSINKCYYNFIVQYIFSSSFTKELKKMLVAGAQPNISTSEIESIILNMPTSEKEQQKIADFLSAIDESIEKVTEQISQTQSFKKAMLQQMFV